MGGSGTDSPKILKGLEAEGHPDYESSSGSLRGPSDMRDMPKDIATQMAGILAL